MSSRAPSLTRGSSALGDPTSQRVHHPRSCSYARTSSIDQPLASALTNRRTLTYRRLCRPVSHLRYRVLFHHHPESAFGLSDRANGLPTLMRNTPHAHGTIATCEETPVADMDHVDADRAVQQLVTGFETLQEEYRALHGQHQALERKLATAREQVRHHRHTLKVIEGDCMMSKPISSRPVAACSSVDGIFKLTLTLA